MTDEENVDWIAVDEDVINDIHSQAQSIQRLAQRLEHETLEERARIIVDSIESWYLTPEADYDIVFEDNDGDGEGSQ